MVYRSHYPAGEVQRSSRKGLRKCIYFFVTHHHVPSFVFRRPGSSSHVELVTHHHVRIAYFWGGGGQAQVLILGGIAGVLRTVHEFQYEYDRNKLC